MEHFEQPDLSTQLPRDMYYQLAHRLRAALPPPVTNSPDDFVRRDNAAIAEAASLLPANAEEASLAAQFVAASAQALDSLALVEQYRTIDPMRADKSRQTHRESVPLRLSGQDTYHHTHPPA
jgi:hypothetical protein